MYKPYTLQIGPGWQAQQWACPTVTVNKESPFFFGIISVAFVYTSCIDKAFSLIPEPGNSKEVQKERSYWIMRMQAVDRDDLHDILLVEAKSPIYFSNIWSADKNYSIRKN